MFMPLLLKSSDPRLLFVTSGLSSLETASQGRISASQNRPYPPRGWPKPAAPSVVAYRSSKTALNMMMIDWCRILKEDGVKIWAISPGFLATNLTGTPEYMKKIGASDPALGGNFIKDVVEGKRDADVGRVIHRDGVAPW
jgi:NAD(P)-dependent dehydrogenase (short-subunit alcohol dehydrogenase family)